jgi:hypothetical protein
LKEIQQGKPLLRYYNIYKKEKKASTIQTGEPDPRDLKNSTQGVESQARPGQGEKETIYTC